MLLNRSRSRRRSGAGSRAPAPAPSPRPRVAGPAPRRLEFGRRHRLIFSPHLLLLSSIATSTRTHPSRARARARRHPLGGVPARRHRPSVALAHTPRPREPLPAESAGRRRRDAARSTAQTAAHAIIADAPLLVQEFVAARSDDHATADQIRCPRRGSSRRRGPVLALSLAAPAARPASRTRQLPTCARFNQSGYGRAQPMCGPIMICSTVADHIIANVKAWDGSSKTNHK